MRQAVGLLSGPGGLASWLRTGTLPPPAASVSLPLDVGTVTDLVPAHLRRAITTRDQHCAAPGCDVPPAGCHVHHIIPRSEGGTTSLQNCLLLCSFHHLILVHVRREALLIRAEVRDLRRRSCRSRAAELGAA